MMRNDPSRSLKKLCCVALTFGVLILAAGAANGAPPPGADGTGRQAASLPPADLSAQFARDVNDAFGLTASSIITVDVEGPSDEPSQMSIAVTLDQQAYTLELWPHSLRADDFKLYADDGFGLMEITPPPTCTYRGVVLDAQEADLPHSRVAASSADGTLTAMIELGDGTTWLVEPVQAAGFNVDASTHVAYRSEDAISPSGFYCGMEPSRHALFSSLEEDMHGDSGGGPRATGYKVTDIAIDGDYVFYQQSGYSIANAMLDIEAIMDSIEFIYERDTDITYEITAIVIRSSAVYTCQADCGDHLDDEFRARWNNSSNPEYDIRRDITHLFTGCGFGGCLGVAYVGVVCNSTLGYGLSNSHWSASWNNRVVVTAHEIGHNWNAGHCESLGDANCAIMCWAAGGCGGYGNPPEFRAASINSIVNHKNSRSCLFPSSGTLADPIALPFSDTFPGSGTPDTSKWSYNEGGANTTGGSSEPSPSYSLNLDATGADTYEDDEIRSNFILMNVGYPVDIEYYTEHIGVESGEKLIVEYWSSDLEWIQLNEIVSDGSSQSSYVFHLQTLIPGSDPEAFHDEFRIRFRTEVNGSNDDWYIDDVWIALSGGDFTPPEPITMFFSSLPAAVSTSEITMTATVAIDADSPPVEYLFWTSPLVPQPGHSSPWQPGRVYVDSDLVVNTEYIYYVRARDSAPTPNMTFYSIGENGAFTLAYAPAAPTLSNPADSTMDLNVNPNGNPSHTEFAVQCTATDPADGNWTGKWVNAAGNPSSTGVWQIDGDWGTITVLSLQPSTDYTFAVKARNGDNIETALGPTATETTAAGDVPGACCYSDGSCAETLPADCTGDWQGEGTDCSPNPCPQPGACCYVDGSCAVTFLADCTGDWQGAGTDCTPNPCPQPGACCYTDGSCVETFDADCTGDWQGVGTTCSPNLCPQPGACCYTDGSCAETFDADCTGDWQGAGTDCNPNPCPQLGACCAADGGCTETFEVDCTGDWQGGGTDCIPNLCPQPGACCAADGSCTVTLQADCTGDWQGAGIECFPNPCPQPGACCAGDGSCTVILEADCTGDWQGAGTGCAPNPCPQPGACCAADGSCTVTLQADCTGDWQGAGINCSPNPCPQLGACCSVGGGCIVTLETDCDGSWRGEGTDCNMTILDDNFETDQDWTTDDGTASSGFWQRGVPANDPDWDYAPAADSDGSGQCWLTENDNNPGYTEPWNTDVDDGAVYLYSPILDLSGGNITISYDYYLRLTDTDGTDRLLVEISSNGGSGPWTEIARHDTDGGTGWRSHTITQGDLDAAGVALTSNMMLQLTTNDGDSQSINESGLDAFLITGVVCGDVSCSSAADGDMDGGGDTNGADIQLFVDGFLGEPTFNEMCHGDFDGDMTLGVGDIDGMVTALLAP